jgi:iron-sulfur cluster assembly protein
MLLQNKHKHDKSSWYCQKKKIIDLMKDDGFDAATDYGGLVLKALFRFILWFEIDNNKGEDDKIFIDNDITIAVEKKSFI